jgi:hypothetical protein
MKGMRVGLWVLMFGSPIAAMAAVAFVCPLLEAPVLVSVARLVCLILGGLVGLLSAIRLMNESVD